MWPLLQVYAITKLGLLFVYDLTTATAVYRNRISPDPIFLTANSESTGGFYAINKCAFHLAASLLALHRLQLSSLQLS